MMNNLFSYSPKELSTDAFLAWYIKEYEDKQTLQGKATPFFHQLGLCEKPDDAISDIRVFLQKDRVDLMISYRVNGDKVQTLFENKLRTSAHSGQLRRYAERFPAAQLRYMKLGYINYAERQEAEKNNYDVIDVYKLKTALETSIQSNLLVEQYIDYLKSEFIRPQDEIRNELIENNKYCLFEKSEAQQYLLSNLHEAIDSSVPYLKFKYSANRGGTPWTQLDIAKRKNAYGDSKEYLFWRIDKRSRRYYLRLNQYSGIDADKYWSQKQSNLNVLRMHVPKLLEIKGLTLSKVSNRGTNESEVAILFFQNNHLSEISKHLPSLSKEIYHFYTNYKSWT